MTVTIARRAVTSDRAWPPRADGTYAHPETPEELARFLRDPMARLCSGFLYKIMVKSANDEGDTTIPFKPNRAQRRFIARLWTRNIILKARQLGFTTLVAIMWLDHALFNADQRCVMVAQDRDKAEEIFRDKVRHAYVNLPASIQRAIPLRTENKSELMFANNSSIKVSTSARGGTPHRLHISEYGKIGATDPGKAKEIKTGSLPAVPIDGITIIESTAEGEEGEFHDMTMVAMAVAETGRPLTPRDYRFHFFPWWQEPGYRLPPDEAAYITITPKEHDYFNEVEQVMNTELDGGQRAWYIATRDADFSGDPEDMWQEFPSTPKEAFQQSTEGHYYAVQLAQARKAGRITDVPYVEGYPVNTFWDIGSGDGTAIWLHQHIGMVDRFFGFIEGWEKPYSYFGAELQRKSAEVGGIVWGVHHLPHDAKHKRQQGNSISSPQDELEKLEIGGRWEVLDRVDDLTHGIQLTRAAFSTSYFDQTHCKDGLAHLAGYKKKWNRSASAWSDEPVKNVHTEAADAYRQFAQGFRAPRAAQSKARRTGRPTWRTV